MDAVLGKFPGSPLSWRCFRDGGRYARNLVTKSAYRAFYVHVTNQLCEDDFRGLVYELTGTLFEII